jgi:hypothetical protein
MTKTLIIPDLHLHWKRADTIIKHESADRIVFLGDYFDDWNDTPAHAREMALWLRDSLSYSNRIHLMGNHDISYAIPSYEFECSGFTEEKNKAINLVLSLDHWKQLKLYHFVDNWVCSHAGVHSHFHDAANGLSFKDFLFNVCDGAISNAFNNLQADPILRAGRSRGGSYPVGGILWCDAREFINITPDVYQIFGHTPHTKPKWLFEKTALCLDVGNSSHYAIHDGKSITTKWVGDL